MHDKQDINLLLEFDSNSGALQNCKIIRNIKDLIKKDSVTLIKVENDGSDRIGSCDFCTSDYEIFLYRLNDEIPELEEKIEISDYLDSVIIKEEIFVEPIQPQKIEDETSVNPVKELKKKPAKKVKGGRVRKSYKKFLEKTDDGYYKCEVCKSEFHSRKSEGNHRSFCNGNNLGRYKAGPNPQCSFCGKTYSSWHSVRTHEKKVHTRSINYICEVCGFNTPIKSSFDNHQLRDHKEQKHVVCDICQYRCSDKNSIRSHIKTKHLKIDTHICEICAMVFSNATRLKLHWMHRHSDERNYPCKICEKAFKTDRALRGHVWQVHTPAEQKPKFSCEVCDFTTHSKFSFTQHKGTHLDNDECPYKCPTCNRGFASKYRFKDHLLVHQLHRPFQCLTCEKSFKRKADLKIHTRYHTGMKVYPN